MIDTTIYTSITILNGVSMILFIVAGTIITGCLNTILSKYQDMQCVGNCEDPDLSKHKLFEQPILQTLQMFIGESLCWIPFFVAQFMERTQRSKNILQRSEYSAIDGEELEVPTNEVTAFANKKRHISSVMDSVVLSIPAICDLTGTTIMNIGLIYVPVSIYQMTRGTLILFVGLFSTLFLKRKISRIEWFSLFVVVFGVFVVGVSGSMKKVSIESAERTNEEVVFGMTLIFIAMVFSASQFVVEEYILNRLIIKPLQIVGYEGFYGGLITFIFIISAHVLKGANTKNSFDMINAFNEMFSNTQVLISSFLIMLCISTFNFFGISLTESLSATSRSTVDTSRTLLVWLVSIAIGWESFSFLQLTGFGFLVLGTLIFNGVIVIPHDFKYLPQWILKDSPNTREDLLINVVDEQIERM